MLLRKVCLHPRLVGDFDTSYEHSGKMTALQLLLESLNAASDHDIVRPRCLIFTQLQASCDLIEEMLTTSMKFITFRRLDGSVSTRQRFTIATEFNTDPSIDVLLLTTGVGGLGLNLTGADTVIFVEHAWNPFTDLQAMDRAHRLGQTKTVQVFRLLAKDTIDEQILDLQAFKTSVARRVVHSTAPDTQANVDDVLHLLQTSSAAPHGAKRTTKRAPTSVVEQMLDELGELWDETQYESLNWTS